VEQSAPAGLPAIASFTVPPGLTAEIAIYDVTGRQVRSLAAGCCPGEHRAAWDGKDCGGAGVASGLYFCVLRASDGCIAAGKVPVVR
jgi:hypothetical protein